MPRPAIAPRESTDPLFADELPTLEEPPTDEADFEKRYHVARAEHCANPDFRFELMCPKAWRCISLSKAAPTYDAPIRHLMHMVVGDSQTTFDVLGVLLEREVDAGDWLACWLEGERERVLGWREQSSAEGRIVDCITAPAPRAEADDAAARVSRTRWFARKFGDRLFVLRSSAGAADAGPEATLDHEALGRTLHLAHTSFRPLSAPDFPLVEHLRTFRPEKPAPVMVVYPQSWVLVQPEPVQDTHVSVNLTNMRRGEVCGLTTFAVLEPKAAHTAEDVRDLYLSQLEDVPNLLPLALTASPGAIAPASSSLEPEVFSGATTDAGEALEVRVSVVRLPECWVLLGTSGPTMWSSPPVWMENKRAHELALANLWTPEELRASDADAGRS